MLEKLALKHDTWKKYAIQICKDKYLADDLVSEMYLKLNQYDKDVNDWYVYFAIKHIYINWIKQENQYCDIINDVVYFDNEGKVDIELPDNLTWVEKQILLLRQSMSCRDIEKQYHINFQKVYRTEKIAKEKLKGWAEKKYAELVT